MAGSVVLVEDELRPTAVYGLRANHDLLPAIVIGVADQHIRPKVVLMIESIDDLKALRLVRSGGSAYAKGERTQEHLTLWRPNRVRIGVRERGLIHAYADRREADADRTKDFALHLSCTKSQ